MWTEPILDRGEACDGEVWCGLQDRLSGFDRFGCNFWIMPGTTVNVAAVLILLLAVVFVFIGWRIAMRGSDRRSYITQ